MKYINIFNSIFIYFRKKNSVLKNVRHKCVIRKINLYFFDDVKNGQTVTSKFCLFQYDPRFFFVEKYVTRQKVRLQKLIKFRFA